jgi:rod shape determining protein RodA
MNYFLTLFRNTDKVLLILPLVFAAISILMIGSTAYDGEFIFNRDLKVQSAAYILGFFAVFVILFIDYRIFQKYEKFLYVASVLFLLTVYIPGLGVEHFGARSWINLGVTDLQPSELVKISFVLLFANYLSRNHESLRTWQGIFLAALYGGPFILIVLKEDLGSAIVMAVMWVTMVFFAGVDGKIFAKLSGLFLLTIPIIYRFMASHQKERIDAFLHPENLSLGGNYQVWHSKVAIGSGGFFGKGLFMGTQKELKFLPVQKSDFIFSVIVEELGMLGGLVLISLYTLFLYRIIKIARAAKEFYGSLIAIGFIGMFGFQIFENIAMTMGIMPVTGITLPFISYGGSSIVSNMIALGLILNVGMRNKEINF